MVFFTFSVAYSQAVLSCLFSLLPKELVAAFAGLALLGAIATNVSVAMKNEGKP